MPIASAEGEFRVNTNTSGNQSDPTVAALSDGGWVVIWYSASQGGSGHGIYGQRYDSTGNAVGTEFQVNTYATQDQFDPSVTGLAEGGWVVTWTSAGQDGSGQGIFSQRFDSTGTAFGNEFQVNSHTNGDQSLSSVTALADGGWLVIWGSFFQVDMWDVYGQRYDSTGTPVGAEFLVNSYTIHNQTSPAVAAMADGGWVVTWYSYGQDGELHGVYGQLYDSTGSPLGAEFQVNTHTAQDQWYPAVTALADGGFVVTWTSVVQDGSLSGIYGQRYDSTGTAVGGEFLINTHTFSSQESSSVTALTDGGFVVTWQTPDGSSWGIFGQRFNNTGTAVGDEFQVNTYTTIDQKNASVTALSNGGWVVIWESAGQDGSSYGVYGQRYHAAENMVSGTEGNDVLEGTAADDVIEALGGQDEAYGLDGDDYIEGGDGNDFLVGGAGNDTVLGGAGDDTLQGGFFFRNGMFGFTPDSDWAGDDVLDGGAGFDNVQFLNGSHGVVVDLRLTGPQNTGYGLDTLISVEAVNGTAFADTLIGNDGTNFLGGWSDPGEDGFNNDTIQGMGGDDLLSVGLGSHVVDGGEGNDAFYILYSRFDVDLMQTVGGTQVSLLLQATTQNTGAGTVLLTGVENLGGFDYDDSLTGDDNANILAGDGGNDVLIGGGGNDILYGDSAFSVNENGLVLTLFDSPNLTFDDQLFGGDGADILIGEYGDDMLDGGSNVDTAIVSGNRADYTVTQTSTGVFEVVGPDGTDTLTAIEFLQFDDQTIRLLPGTGVSVNFETADPSVYQSAMNSIRDFDGNALGGDGSWLRIGSADVDGDGDIDQILVNDAIGRFATVGGYDDGLAYFDDHGWAGETRVVGIYIDPLVQSGDVEQGGPNDSQRRFQNDLQIENINRVLGADDYDGDGLQEVYLALTDGSAYLHLYMHADGNIQYANYQSEQQVIDYLTGNGFTADTWADWFPDTSTAEGPKPDSPAALLQRGAQETDALAYGEMAWLGGEPGNQAFDPLAEVFG